MPAAVFAGMAIAGAVSTAYAAHKAGQAADTQAAAGQQALGVEQQMFNTQQQNLAPYMQAGASVLPSLTARAGAPIQRTGWGQYGTAQTAPSFQNRFAPGPVASAPMTGGPNQFSNPISPGVSAQTTGTALPQGPRVGEVRIVQGQQAKWDGKGWLAV